MAMVYIYKYTLTTSTSASWFWTFYGNPALSMLCATCVIERRKIFVVARDVLTRHYHIISN